MLPSVVKVCLICLHVSLCLCYSEATINIPKNSLVPAVIAFGNSYLDSGNNNFLKTIIKTLADYVALKLGVKDYLPAYLDPSLQDEDIVTGVSFASSGSGLDPTTNKLLEMFKLGARKMVFFNTPIIGCSPIGRNLEGGVIRKCGDPLNEEVRTFDTMLNRQIQFLGSSLPQARFTIVDYFKILQDIIEHYPQYGIDVIDKGCSGTGIIELVVLCNKLSPICPDDSKYLFWDAIHLTDKGYNIAVDHALDDIKKILV